MEVVGFMEGSDPSTLPYIHYLEPTQRSTAKRVDQSPRGEVIHRHGMYVHVPRKQGLAG